MIMPSDDYQYLRDSDMEAIASYVHSLKPVDNELAPNNIMLLPRALLVAGQMPILAAERLNGSGTPMSVTPGATKEYGAYLSLVGGCQGCHGPGLSGGKIPGGDPSWGPAANLTRAGNIGKWTQAEFMATLRTGKRPDGSPLKDYMPWKQVGRMTDEELGALWFYLNSIPAKEFGNPIVGTMRKLATD